MQKLTFQKQMYLGIGVLVICFLLSTFTKHGIFTNIGWGFYGLLFLIHPVWPQRLDYEDHRRLKFAFRIGAGIVILLALITRFGV